MVIVRPLQDLICVGGVVKGGRLIGHNEKIPNLCCIGFNGIIHIFSDKFFVSLPIQKTKHFVDASEIQ